VPDLGMLTKGSTTLFKQGSTSFFGLGPPEKKCMNVYRWIKLTLNYKLLYKAWEVAGIVLAVPYNYLEVQEFYGNIFYIMF
jgi:hypothetical protein